MVAQKWLAKHELPDSYVDQIVDFIDKNTSGVSIGSTTAGTDPFTGAGSYRPGNSAPNTTGNVGVDPFTGAGSYRPNQPGSSHKSSGVDPWTGEPLMYPSWSWSSSIWHMRRIGSSNAINKPSQTALLPHVSSTLLFGVRQMYIEYVTFCFVSERLPDLPTRQSQLWSRHEKDPTIQLGIGEGVHLDMRNIVQPDGPSICAPRALPRANSLTVNSRNWKTLQSIWPSLPLLFQSRGS